MKSQLVEVLSSLFVTDKFSVTDSIKEEAIQHAVYSLIATDSYSLQFISKNIQIIYEQKEIGNALGNIPYIIIKGTSAAIYYPEPLRRVLGDIDVIVKPKDFLSAFNAFISAGYSTVDSLNEEKRHVHFYRNGILIELHRRFAQLNSKEQEMLLDNWIFHAEPVEGIINGFSFPMLPPILNGLTLLTHINQHLENGLGLRQILDWVMYVDKMLPDEKWEDFCLYTDQIGLTTLAITTARIGQLYFHAYPKYTWCHAADDRLCSSLLDYVLKCGNFGAKLGTNNTVTMILSHSKGVRGLFQNLQKRGEGNWDAVKRHPFLKPFSWAYQAVRYAKKSVENGVKVGELKSNIDASRERNALIEALGVKQQTLRDHNS